MKKLFIALPIAVLLIFLMLTIYSCKRSFNDDPNTDKTPKEIPKEILLQIKKLGFDTVGIIQRPNGFIVEKDIFLSFSDLKGNPSKSPIISVAHAEQYRTTNIVAGLPRTITISVQNLPAAHIQAVDDAISRYNQLRFGLSFMRVNSGGEIVIQGYSATDGVLAYSGTSLTDPTSGFPSNNGNPAANINLNQYYTSGMQVVTVTSIIQHEIGHTIGFRHTDWQDRAYSCGGNSVTEPVNPFGAINIPGTPTGADQESWMLACLGNVINRNFSPNDIFALAYLYNPSGGGQPGSQPVFEYYNSANTDNVVTINQNYHNIYSGWTYVTSTFRAFLNNSTSGTIPIYEYYNSSQKDHAYSPTPNDPNIIGYPGWAQVGLSFYVYSSNISGSIPVYWYYKSSQSRHLYTSNPNINAIESGWSTPQIAWYAPQ